MKRKVFTRDEVLSIVSEIDTNGIDEEAITYDQALSTIIQKIGHQWKKKQ